MNYQKSKSGLKSNPLFLNISKTSYLFFTRSKNEVILNINIGKIDQSDCVKYLGVYFDEKLRWNKYIDYCILQPKYRPFLVPCIN